MHGSMFSYVSDLLRLSDEQAMLRLQKKNDSRVFALLVSRWEERVQRFCARLTGDLHGAEDLGQEVFMRVFRHRNDYRHAGRFSTYLWRIARNVCYDEHRRIKRQGKETSIYENGEKNDSEMEPASSVPSPVTAAEGNERADLVRKALLTLPDNYREVVILRHYEGLKYREIAEVLEIAEGTVKSRMAEALARLARLLKPTLDEKGGR